MTGYGAYAVLTVARDGNAVSKWALNAGSTITAEMNGVPFTFTLGEAQADPKRVLDGMAADQIAEYLARRIRDDENAREQDALEERFYE